MNLPARFLTSFIILTLMNCSGTTAVSENSTNADSITAAVVDTTSKNAANIEEANYVVIPREQLLKEVESAVDSMIEIEKARSVYSLSGSFNGYESSADATYYFDSLFSLTYCEITWSSEGSSGSGTYFFDADEVDGGKTSESAGDSEDITVFYSLFQPQYGVTTTLMSEYDPAYTIFDGPAFIAERSSVKNDYNRLVNRIIEYKDQITMSETDASIDVENETDSYGETFTERETFRMSIEVYEKVIKPEL
jgi:hypothetical protein